MDERAIKPVSRLKTSLASLLILGTCGAVAYNVLALQPNRQQTPGSTAVRVQVRDIDIANVPLEESTSSIGQLLRQTQSSAKTAQVSALTASIQNQLTYLGFYKGKVDGQIGPQTFAAIKFYQQQNSLKQTGKTSYKLLDHLKFTRKIAEAGNNTGSIGTDSAGNSEVRQVQERLAVFGYAPGTPDGLMGVATRKAIKQFETDRKMPITGKITAALLQELGS